MRPRLLGGAFFLLGVVVMTADPLNGQPGRGGFGGPPGGGFGGPTPGGFGGPPGGGFSGRGGMNFSPEQIFAFASQGAETIDLSKMSPDQLGRVKGMMDRWGIAMPPNGVITKQQFVAAYTQAQAAKAAAGGGQPGVGGPQPGFAAPPQPGFTMQPQPGGYQQPGFGGPQQPGFGAPPGGVQMQFGMRGGGGMSDEDAIRRFKDSDRDQDGRLSWDEASSKSRENWAEIDVNQNKYLELDEYRAYIARRYGPGAQQNGGQPGFGGYPQPGYGGFPQPGFDPRNGGGDPRFTDGGNGGNGGDPRDPRNRKAEDFTNVGIRYGKLPPGLPDWFAEYDQDKDGQINMYEWRTVGGKTVAEFRELDANEDGLIAPQELIRVTALKADAERYAAIEAGEAPAKSSSSSGRGPGGSMSGKSFGPGGPTMMFGPKGGDPRSSDPRADPRSSDPRADRKEERREEKGGGPNPFRMGGKKGG